MAIADNECLKKSCKKGYPEYFAIVLDPVTGEETASRPLSGTEYIDAGGAGGLSCPPSGNRTMITPRYPVNTGNSFVSQVMRQGSQLRLDANTMERIKELMPYRWYFITQLRNNGVHVTDPNNIYEILSKFAKFNPHYTSPSNDVMIAAFAPKKAAFKSQYKTRDNQGNAQYQPKSSEAGSSGGGVDTSWIGGLVSLIGSIASGINSSSAQDTLNTWAANYVAYMQKDFGDIRGTLASSGGAEALKHFYAFKNGSWKGLDNDINTLCLKNNLDVPEQVKIARTQQDALETELKRLAGQGGTTPISNNNNGFNGSGTNNPFDPNNTSAGGWIARNWMWLVGGMLVLIILGLVFMKMFKK